MEHEAFSEGVSQVRRVYAEYNTEHGVPAYMGNPLIEALPPIQSDEMMMASITKLPNFSPEQRNAPRHVRLHMILELTQFLLPFTRHIELAQYIDTRLRRGYVGRAPYTKDHIAALQEDYQNRQRNIIPFNQDKYPVSVSSLNTLLGFPGTGKTLSAKTILNQYDSVITHKQYGITQIPYLMAQMPDDGSTTALGYQLLNMLDELMPTGGYYQKYGQKRKGAGSILASVAHVFTIHFGGMIIIDEANRLLRTAKDSKRVVQELVNFQNSARAPILYLATEETRGMFSSKAHMARRNSGGLSMWKRWPKTCEGYSEWEAFIKVLWRYQWVQQHSAFDKEFNDVMYECSQGIPDIAVKLFVSAQFVAISSKTEKITPTLIRKVYDAEFQVIHPLMLALQKNEEIDVSQFSDLSEAINWDRLIKSLTNKNHVETSSLFDVDTEEDAFVSDIAGALVTAGLDSEKAYSLANIVKSRGPFNNKLEALMLAATLAMPIKPPKGKSRKSANGKDAATPLMDLDLSNRKEDYRYAIQEALKAGTKFIDKMREFGMMVNVLDMPEFS
jgi:hypothetical protein